MGKTGRIFSPGKLLITSEYFVLDGSLSLAVPTKYGQDLCYEFIDDHQSIIIWKAFHQNILWLEAKIDYKNWNILETNNKEASLFILKVLKNIESISTKKFEKILSYVINTNLEFPSDFGLGSSSTLMSNLAQWAEIDPFVLNEMSLGGSGYDVAVAIEKLAILYQLAEGKRSVQKVNYDPDFKDELILIHLNKKQDTREGISLYKTKEKSQVLIDEFTQITKDVFEAKKLEDFALNMEKSEKLIGDFLNISPVKEKFFSDCPSFVKSLGAWGGDFVLSSKFPKYKEYFRDKGFASVFGWSELVK